MIGPKKISSLKIRDKRVENNDEKVRDTGDTKKEGLIDMQLELQERRAEERERELGRRNHSQELFKTEERHQAQIQDLKWMNGTQDN